LQSIYSSAVIQATAFLVLLPVVLCGTAAWGKPREWWTLFAGIYGSPIFFMPLAATVVGTEATVLVVLSAQLCTALVLDLVSGVVKLTDWQRLGGFGLVLLGAFVNASDAMSGVHLGQTHVPEALGDTAALMGHMQGLIQNGHGVDSEPGSSVFLLAVAAVGGLGVTIESNCNCRLAKDLGCWSRAACWDAFISVLSTVPVGLLFYFKFQASPVLLQGDWPRFLFSGVGVAFFQSSMAVLPEKLGFTVSFMCVKFGSLFMSTYIDAKGIGGMVVPVSTHRLVSLLLVSVGCLFFATGKTPQTDEALDDGHKKGYGAIGALKVAKCKV